MARRDYEGHSVETTITAQVNPTDLVVTLTASTGWPTGGANGEFFITINPDLVNEERVLVASRSGATLTIANTGKRGQDGTSAQTHAAGSIIRHSYAAVEADEANFHINDTTHDHHTQYMKTDGTRHDLSARHTYGAALGSRPIPVAVGTSLAAGSGAAASAGDHVHTIGAGAINSSGMFTVGIVDAAAIAADAVGASELADNSVAQANLLDNSVGTLELIDLNVTSAKLAAAAVIAGKIAAGGVSATNQVADGIVSLAKFLSEASTSYTPSTFCAAGTFSLGTGGTSYGHYFKLGRIIVGWTGFQMAADGNLVGILTIPLPLAMRTAGADAQRGFAAARAQGGANNVFSGTGVILSGATQVNNIFTAGAGAAWDSDTPFNWGTAGVGASDFDSVFFYEAAT